MEQTISLFKVFTLLPSQYYILFKYLLLLPESISLFLFLGSIYWEWESWVGKCTHENIFLYYLYFDAVLILFDYKQ